MALKYMFSTDSVRFEAALMNKHPDEIQLAIFSQKCFFLQMTFELIKLPTYFGRHRVLLVEPRRNITGGVISVDASSLALLKRELLAKKKNVGDLIDPR